MPINQSHRNRFSIYFLGLFYLLAIYKLLNGIWLFQVAPFYFINRFDGTSWMFMQTGIHQWLLDNKGGWILFDSLFYSMPLVWYIIANKNEKAGRGFAIIWLLINWVYIQTYTLFPTNSIESYAAWLLMPILFATRKIKSFYFLMHAMRYFFLFFFASAAIWKFRQGGIFYMEEMSGILLVQHKEFLVSAPESWYSAFIYAIIQQPTVGYLLYLAGALLELAFLIGFFTRKYDHWLIAGFLLFIAMDMLIMHIPYFETLPLALPLLFSKYAEPEVKGVISAT